MVSKKLPSTLFLTFRNESYQDKKPPLGFASAYEPGTVAFGKKKSAQMTWAYPGLTYHTPLQELRGDEVWIRSSKFDVDSRAQIVGEWEKVSDELQPKIIDNHAMSGFKLLTSVSRHSTSNKLWRVLDPRGFQLEITTGCLEEIILNGDIIKGELIGNFKWGASKRLVRIS